MGAPALGFTHLFFHVSFLPSPFILPVFSFPLGSVFSQPAEPFVSHPPVLEEARGDPDFWFQICPIPALPPPPSPTPEDPDQVGSAQFSDSLPGFH